MEAVNTAPEAHPSAIAGPTPPTKNPTGNRLESRGLTVVPVGEKVYLRGWGVDENFPSPELYNPGGNDPDLYGKNNDHLQRAFGWQWSLQYQPENASSS